MSTARFPPKARVSHKNSGAAAPKPPAHDSSSVSQRSRTKIRAKGVECVPACASKQSASGGSGEKSASLLPKFGCSRQKPQSGSEPKSRPPQKTPAISCVAREQGFRQVQNNHHGGNHNNKRASGVVVWRRTSSSRQCDEPQGRLAFFCVRSEIRQRSTRFCPTRATLRFFSTTSPPPSSLLVVGPIFMYVLIFAVFL